jgi:hypothetical protein
MKIEDMYPRARKTSKKIRDMSSGRFDSLSFKDIKDFRGDVNEWCDVMGRLDKSSSCELLELILDNLDVVKIKYENVFLEKYMPILIASLKDVKRK